MWYLSCTCSRRYAFYRIFYVVRVLWVCRSYSLFLGCAFLAAYFFSIFLCSGRAIVSYNNDFISYTQELLTVTEQLKVNQNLAVNHYFLQSDLDLLKNRELILQKKLDCLAVNTSVDCTAAIISVFVVMALVIRLF